MSTSSPHHKKGFALIVVLMITAMMGLSVTALYSISNLNLLIAGNYRRQTQASVAATSGVSHFMALNIPASTLAKSLRDHSSSSQIIIPRTPLDGRRTYYTVSVSICCDKGGRYLPEDTIFVESMGEYSKAGRVIASHKVRATVVFE